MKSPLTAALWLFATTTLLAQWRPSPFPATAPVAGYVLQNAFPSHAALPPWQLVNLTSNAGRLFVVEKNGRVYVITNAANPTKSLFLDNSADTFNVGESGLFGIAFHPSGNWVFAWANETNRTSRTMEGRLSRWTIDPSNTNRVLANSKFVLIAQLDEELTHSGGDIKFGPDGYLYISTGDGGPVVDWETPSALIVTSTPGFFALMSMNSPAISRRILIRQFWAATAFLRTIPGWVQPPSTQRPSIPQRCGRSFGRSACAIRTG